MITDFRLQPGYWKAKNVKVSVLFDFAVLNGCVQSILRVHPLMLMWLQLPE